MYNYRCILIVVLLSVATAHALGGCEKYRIAVKALKSCKGYDDENVFKVTNFSISLDSKCMLAAKACINSPKGFTSGKGVYMLQKGTLERRGDFDLCEHKLCPVTAGDHCKELSADISQVKQMFAFLQGDARAVVKIAHDAGRTCLTAEAAIKMNG